MKNSTKKRIAELQSQLSLFNMELLEKNPSRNDLLCALESAMKLIESLNEGLDEDNLMKAFREGDRMCARYG
jgi:hypothetical protein